MQSIEEWGFKNNYMKKDPNAHARKMMYGVLHIRYHDKKLLRDLLNLIELHKQKFCVSK